MPGTDAGELDSFGGLVAATVDSVERMREPADAGPDTGALTRLRRGRGSLDDLDAWRAARGMDVARLLAALAGMLGIFELLSSWPSGGAAPLYPLPVDLVPHATTAPGPAFPHLLRRSAYLPLADTPEAELVLGYARVVARALTPASPPPLPLRLTGLASDLAAVADDLEEVAKELRNHDALVLGGQVAHHRRRLARMVDALDGMATELKEGRLR